MPKKREDGGLKHNPLFEAIRQIEVDNPEIIDKDDRYNIVDVMTFCNDQRFLDLPTRYSETGKREGNGLILFIVPLAKPPSPPPPLSPRILSVSVLYI